MEKGEGHHTPTTSIIIAALNEEEGIGLTISELKGRLADASILVVDAGVVLQGNVAEYWHSIGPGSAASLCTRSPG